MFNKKLKKKITELEEENKQLSSILDTYLPISDITYELNFLEKERDELVETIEQLKESKKSNFHIVEKKKNQAVCAERMRIEKDVILFENSIKIEKFDYIHQEITGHKEWFIVASCPLNLTVTKI